MILVTGFGPYQEDINASGELVRSLEDNLPEELARLEKILAFEVITCDDASREAERQSLKVRLDEMLKRYEPELCIHTGQAPPHNKIILEKMATNSFMRETIEPRGPAAYWSNLPGTDSLRTVLEDQNIPAGYSFYAGQHLCNHILYSSLHLAEKNDLSHKSGFIHIPVLPEQVIGQYRDAPYMPAEMSRKALSLIIDHVAEAHRQNESPQTTAESGG